MHNIQDEYRKLPGVDKVLADKYCRELSAEYGFERVRDLVRDKISAAREEIKQGKSALSIAEIVAGCTIALQQVMSGSLKRVINGSGIVLHTNLGRAPLGEQVMADISRVVSGYCNLEYDLGKGRRGHRNDHIREIIKEITGAEDAVVVNNNAAAVMLVFKTLAAGREVVVSRGEQIEIGGAFRIPDILAESGAVMREVGCTNRTRISDYARAINDETKMLFKAHKSNYYIGGFCEEVALEDMTALAHERGLVMFYDIGSGLFRKPAVLADTDEPDVRSALAAGVDLVSFSGDKLLGGPQAGIIAGKKEYIEQIATAPLMRALRVGKLTMSALMSVMQGYLSDKLLVKKLPIFALLNRSLADKQVLAEKVQAGLERQGIVCEVVESEGRCGGGTMPALKIPSRGVRLKLDDKAAEELFFKLLKVAVPVVGILREGEFVVDVMSVRDNEIEDLIKIISEEASGIQ